MLRCGLLLLSFFCTILISAQQTSISGKVNTSSGEAAAFAVIGCTELETGISHGSTADEQGNYKINLPRGHYKLTCHLIGHFDYDEVVKLESGKTRTIHIILQENPAELRAVEIYSDTKDFAREVVRNAIASREKHLGKNECVNYDSYSKISLQENMPDTTESGRDSAFLQMKMRDRPRVTYQKRLLESVSKVRYAAPDNYNEEVIGHQNFNPKPPSSRGGGTSISVEYGETDIVPQQQVYDDNYILRTYTGYQEFNLYRRMLDLKGLTEKKILSPIGEGALLSYRYDLDGMLFDDTTKIFVIRFSPIFPGEALFSGTMNIREDNWALEEALISLPKHALYFFENFHASIKFTNGQTNSYYIGNISINYTIREGNSDISANIIQRNTDIRAEFENAKFSDQTISYQDDAFDRDSIYWIRERPLAMNTLETRYAQYCDSLQKHFSSPEHFEEKDSIYNQVRFMDFILYGVGFRNHQKKQSIFINPLIMQINPVGIGGYRHRLGGNYEKEFSNDYLLETDAMIDYGFRNRDVRGKLGAGLTYVPKKFVRTYLRVGDYYDMINNYASLGSVFSRSNYVRTQMMSIAQRMEIINGLFAELTFEYSDQKPISDLAQDQWSQQLFGDINAPIEFDRYIKSELRLDIKYRFKQKYIIKKNKKILLGSDYPEVNVVYRKGIPRLFNSEINFDYLEVGIRHEKELGRLGNMEWSVLGGSFLNKKNLRILEHKYFRGSDILFFSDPLRSFQLLGPTLSTPNTYLRGNYFHHFNGIVFNKIPLIRRLKLTEAAGVAMLSIPDQNFFHTEFYAGLERVIRIRQEIFRIGVYACTAESSFNKARFEFKLGFNFFDSFHKKWNY
jgi:hypothetical protein